ncbi:MAG: hypothetical protein QME12_05710 [Nanoarchaeota archaeon]|nr:hypothetical protein [Nanoarchaeota archaeon]
MKDIFDMSQDDLYECIAKKRITAHAPRASEDRSFGANAQAYKWTNEALVELKTEFGLDLAGRDMLLIACSGDPSAVFAYLNAGNQVAFDTSHKAVLWSELKMRAVEIFSWQQFCWFFGLGGQPSGTRPQYSDIRRGISEYAVAVFDELFKGAERASDLFGNGNFFRQGYSGAFPQSNIFTTSEEDYERAKQNLLRRKLLFVPGSLEDVFKFSDNKFGAFYGSNAMDHFTNMSGKLDYSVGNIKPFLETIDTRLEGNAKMVLQFEWSQELRDNAIALLKEMGYETKLAPGNATGYGRLCVASTKKHIKPKVAERAEKNAEELVCLEPQIIVPQIVAAEPKIKRITAEVRRLFGLFNKV